jgi:nucleoside-diphosphate-sugar epimerase/phosphohistidine swiveling domain-containing protein
MALNEEDLSAMRVLVTGATGSFGVPLCRSLAARGHEVFAMARRTPNSLPAGVTFRQGDVEDLDSVASAVEGMDAVIHLAWLVSSTGDATKAHGINVIGTDNVLAAMRRHSVGRLVFASSVMGYGSHAGHGPYTEDEPLRAEEGFLYGFHKRLVEKAIEESGVPSLVVRTGPVVGRTVRNVVTDQFAAPSVQGVKGDDSRWQFVHSDDVTRFLADAVAHDRTGVVNLAAPGALSIERVGELLGKPVNLVPYRVAKAAVKGMWAAGISDIDPAALDALRYLPVADTTKLENEFGFVPAWSNEDCVRDMRRALLTYVHVGKYDIRRISNLPYVDPGWKPDMSPSPGHVLEHIGPPELRGEFDDLIDPTMSDYTATNVGESFPGPLTPLSLELGLTGIRAATEVTNRMVGFDGWLAHECQSRFVASFAHNIYLSVSLTREVYRRMPGSSAAEADAQYCGIALPEGYKAPRMTLTELRSGLRLMRRGGPAMLRYAKSEQWAVDEASRLVKTPDELARTADGELQSWFSLIWDTCIDAQIINCNAALVGGAALSAAERKSGGHGVTAGGLASSAALEGVRRAASIVRSDPGAAKALELVHAGDAPMSAVAELSPELDQCLREVLETVGHRGPGEFELSNPTFSDRPKLLLDAIRGAAASPERHGETLRDDPSGLVEKMAASALQRRERIRDALVRLYHQLRLTLREIGGRMTAEGRLASPDDVFYLTYEEILNTPADSLAITARRRAERERLKQISMPRVIRGEWRPTDVAGPSVDGDALSGNGVSAGVVRGTVRVLRAADDGLEPGEILVCRVTDVGWTPLFVSAAAVVSEIGGAMSHTAVVAREFGIPAVVSVDGATDRLQDGQLVEVDGGRGLVTILSSQP